MADAARLVRPDKTDLAALATRAWPVLHRLGPVFEGSRQWRAIDPDVPGAQPVAQCQQGRRFPDAPIRPGIVIHLHTGLPVSDRQVVLTAVLADATNLGLTRMADACTVASYRQLVWTAGWHVREDTYRQALATIVDAQQRHPLAAAFGAADVSSSDGQHFPTAGRGEAVGAINARYGHDATALFYTHHSARHAPYHIAAIRPSGEAAHVIDGLLYHEADLSIATHHTDGGGVSDHVFALTHLLGFQFASRIPNLAERRLYAFDTAGTWPSLAPFIAGRPDEKLIAAHWDDLLRLAASVRTGVVSASLMLKRLGAYPRQNGLALALREVGRIERTRGRESAGRPLPPSQLHSHG